MSVCSVFDAGRALVRCSLAVLALALAPVVGSQAAEWPERPVRIVVPFGAGGSTDALARIVGAKLSEQTRQPVVIDNRAGAAGSIGAVAVAKSPADGYTLLLATSSTHAVLPQLRSLPYDAARDFSAIARLAVAPNVLVVSPKLAAASVAEFLQAARQRTQPLAYSSSGNGSVTHLIGADFSHRAKLRVTHVPYKTGIQALADLNAGQVDFAFDSIVWTLAQSQAGKVKALAIGGAQRSRLAPDLPTLQELGFEGFDGSTWFALMGPAGLPAPVVQRINQLVNQALNDPDLKTQFERQGAEALGGSPADLERLVKEDGQKWATVIKTGGIKADE